MSIAAAFGLIWRSSHILPRDAFNDLCECVDESQKAAVRAAPARRSVRVAARPVACLLSATGDGRRGLVGRNDAGPAVAAGQLRGEWED